MKKLKQLLGNIITKEILGSLETGISSVEFDSRKIQPGSLFIATRGTQSDGHDYIETAIAKGAVAIVCEILPAEI